MVVHEGGFDDVEAAQLPLADGHFFDGLVLDVAIGLELGDVLVEEGLEFLGVFVVEDDGAGEQAMADGVAGGTLLAEVGDRAAGFGSVLLGGELALRGRHAGVRIGDCEGHLAQMRCMLLQAMEICLGDGVTTSSTPGTGRASEGKQKNILTWPNLQPFHNGLGAITDAKLFFDWHQFNGLYTDTFSAREEGYSVGDSAG